MRFLDPKRAIACGTVKLQPQLPPTDKPQIVAATLHGESDPGGIETKVAAGAGDAIFGEGDPGDNLTPLPVYIESEGAGFARFHGREIEDLSARPDIEAGEFGLDVVHHADADDTRRGRRRAGERQGGAKGDEGKFHSRANRFSQIDEGLGPVLGRGVKFGGMPEGELHSPDLVIGGL